jgi:hypothetical protein
LTEPNPNDEQKVGENLCTEKSERGTKRVMQEGKEKKGRANYVEEKMETKGKRGKVVKSV